MRKRVVILTFVVIGSIGIWLLGARKPAEPPTEAAPTPTPQAQKSGPTPDLVTPTTPSPNSPSDSHEATFARYNAAFRRPIRFYGKVVDQHSDTVAGADVRMTAVDKPWKRPSIYERKTDSNGLFSIEGILGLDLSVAVSKPGYRVIPAADNRVTSSGIFNFGLSHPHQPDHGAPVIFTLHKVGTIDPLLRVGEKNFRIARDGSPVSIAVDEQGARQVILRCWNQELQRPAGQRQYDWRLEVSVPNGGLLPRKDAFAFEAPEDGYLPSETVDMPAALGNQWRSFAERSYFIRFGDGTFARANLRMRAGGDHFVVWESFFNPKPGSRNLE